MQRTSSSSLPNIFRPLTFKAVSTPFCLLCRELHRGRVQLLGAAIVVGSGRRFRIISFSALSACHREQLRKYGRPDEEQQ